MKNIIINKILSKRLIITALLAIVILLINGVLSVNKAVSTSCGTECFPDYYYKNLNILVLGDSFSAGNGLGRSRIYASDGCYRHEKNWSSIFREWLLDQGILASVENRACSGATTKDILEKRQWNLNRRIFDGYVEGWSDSMTEKEIKDKILKAYCTNHRFHIWPAEAIVTGVDAKSIKAGKRLAITKYSRNVDLLEQVHWVDPKFDAVFLTIGGNDLGFSNLIKTCVTLFPSKFNFLIKPLCPIFLEQAFNELKYTKKKIVEVLKNINSRLRPDAKIVLLGCPLMSLDNQNWLGDFALSRHFRQIGKELNQLQAEAVRELNQEHPDKAYFVGDVQDYFAGHEPNLNVFLPNPNRWITNILEPGLTLNFNHWFHPNTKGHRAYAEILQSLSKSGKVKPLASPGKTIDIVFNIDTNTTMHQEINLLKYRIKNLAEHIKKQVKHARFAVTSFKQNIESALMPDYEYKLKFTDNINELVSIMQKITANGAGGILDRRLVWSSLDSSLDGSWRDNVEKIIITLTNGKPHDKDPGTENDARKILKTAFELDPVKLYFITTGDENLSDHYYDTAEKSGGVDPTWRQRRYRDLI